VEDFIHGLIATEAFAKVRMGEIYHWHKYNVTQTPQGKEPHHSSLSENGIHFHT
jgi:hypothetical protein